MTTILLLVAMTAASPTTAPSEPGPDHAEPTTLQVAALSVTAVATTMMFVHALGAAHSLVLARGDGRFYGLAGANSAMLTACAVVAVSGLLVAYSGGEE